MIQDFTQNNSPLSERPCAVSTSSQSTALEYVYLYYIILTYW